MGVASAVRYILWYTLELYYSVLPFVVDPQQMEVWNSLPTDIKLHRSTTTSFKRRLKTVLFNRGFIEYM